MNKIFNDFSEIADDVKEKVQNVLYKYRIWEDDFHKKILRDNIIWFTHPKELNDPYDIRVPVRFDFREIDHPLFIEKLKFYTQSKFPFLNPDSRDFRVICDNKLELIKENPQKHFEDNYLEMRESDVYDRVGVFSLSKTKLDETMWAHYSKNLQGFCIGFKSFELLKDFSKHAAFGHVYYNDEPPLHSFIKSFEANQKDEMYLKHTKWDNEKEFRLLTLNIKKDSDRAVKFDPQIISEIVVGSKISEKNLEEIVEVLKIKYKSKVALYKIHSKASSYGFSKKLLTY